MTTLNRPATTLDRSAPATRGPLDSAAARPLHRRPGYAICHWIARLLFIGLLRGRVFGAHYIPKSGGVLLVSNHQSFFDPVLAGVAVPRECHYMARDSLFERPLLRAIIEYLNAFPVKRGTADTGAIKETIRRLRAGHVVVTFPEATRTYDGRIGPMRGGVVLIARKVRLPIVPTLILGAFEAWPRTAKLPGLHPVLVAYDRPIYPHEHPEWDEEACVERVRERILAMQARFEAARR